MSRAAVMLVAADQRSAQHVETVEREARARAFDELIASGPLSVAFQPIVDLTTGEPLGYEVLGRVGPLDGALAAAASGPAQLLDAAHAAGRLLALDRRWRSLAVAAIAASRDDRARWFINVDPRVVEDPSHAPGFTRDLVARHGLDPARFVLELTEAPSVDAESIERVLREYRAQGFGLAIDDLGAPLQSMATLLRVRPEYVKIDRAVARGIDRDELRQHLLRSLVDFAERAGVRLVVEGIETEEELRAVRDAGATLAQGYLLGRPRPLAAPLPPRAALALRADHGRAAGRRARSLEDALLPLLQVVEAISTTSALEPALRHVTAFAAELLEVERVSIRLLDESRTRLLVAARTGASVHASPSVDFAIGEGLVGWVVQHRKPLLTGRANDDPRFAHRPGLQAPFASFLGVPLLDEEGCIGVLATTAEAPLAFTDDDERRLRLVASIVAPRLQVARLRRLLLTDPLTCLWNRRALDELLPSFLPEGTPSTSVVAVDIDRFKAINDRHGHAVGDEVLRRVGRALASAVRESDHVVRVGGEELVLVLNGATTDEARAVAERARAAVRASASLDDGAVTISAGVATRGAGEPWADVLARADAALYRAKRAGRDRVEIADERASDERASDER